MSPPDVPDVPDRRRRQLVVELGPDPLRDRPYMRSAVEGDPIMTTGFLAEPWHRHDHRCYWDHTRCGWVCPAEEVTEAETHLSEQPLDRPGSAAEPHRERVQSISAAGKAPGFLDWKA
jgi:hypothetical protein